jgi:hypothetical protein
VPGAATALNPDASAGNARSPAPATPNQDTARSVKLREDAPPLAKTGTTVFSLAFGALLVPAGIVLLMAIAGAAWLLIVGGVRRAWPWRRRD